MLIVDAHLDLGTLAMIWDRDITRPVSEIRQMEAGMTDKKWRGNGTVALPELRKGRVAVTVSVIWARASGFRSREITHSIARAQLEYFRLLEAQGQCRLILNRGDLEDHVREWRYWEKLTDAASGNIDIAPPKLGFIISMECADPILYPEQIEQWWRDGLRIIGPAHGDETVYAHGTRSKGGLKSGAASLLSRMRKVGMILDTTHLSDQSFWEALDIWDGPVLSSHVTCRSLVPGERQHDDKQIRAITERGGMLGIAMASYMLSKEWVSGKSSREAAGLEHVVNHIDHICQLAGNAKHVGIGTDLDGGFGREQTPHDVDSVADLQKLSECLERRGYKPEEIEDIMHGNWLRFFSDHLPLHA